MQGNISSTSHIRLSRHAEARLQQRGITGEVADLVRAHADIELAVGRGCTELRLSDRAMLALLADGTPARLVDKARDVAVIVSEGETVLVTAMRVDRRRRRTARMGAGRRRPGRRA
jgi:hypothetical protein